MSTSPLVSQTTRFLKIAQLTSQDYIGELSRWNGSPFQWFIGLAPRRKGAIGERMIDLWLTSNGFKVSRPKHTGCDRIVNGVNFEIKLSTLWGSGIYTFQQLRDQDYEQVFCLGLSPEDVHAWVVPKAVMVKKSVAQHGGKLGRDTRWLQFPAYEAPVWIKQYGGTLDQAYEVLLNLEMTAI